AGAPLDGHVRPGLILGALRGDLAPLARHGRSADGGTGGARHTADLWTHLARAGGLPRHTRGRAGVSFHRPGWHAAPGAGNAAGPAATASPEPSGRAARPASGAPFAARQGRIRLRGVPGFARIRGGPGGLAGADRGADPGALHGAGARPGAPLTPFG